jgi:hypothetical protein
VASNGTDYRRNATLRILKERFAGQRLSATAKHKKLATGH